MKELHGTAGAAVPASPERCLALLADVESYSSWYPEVVRRVEVLERANDGRAQQAHANLHVPNVPLIGDLQLLVSVEIGAPDVVRLTRLAHGPEDPERFVVTWRLREVRDGTEIEVALDATLSVPRLVPLGGIGDRIASGFLAAAARALAGDDGT